mgnify:CR=1 FL=1
MRELALLVAVTIMTASCFGGYSGPSAGEKWPIIAERAKFDLACQDLEHTVLADGQPRTTGEAHPRVYYDFAVTGCGKRGVFRVLFFRGGQDEVQVVGPVQ